MRRLLLSHFWLMVTCVAFAQVTMSGKVSDQATKSAIPFANVVLHQADDTTKVFAGTMSDEEGQFSLEGLPVGRYRVTISSMGYEPLQLLMRLVIPSSGNVLVKNFELTANGVELGAAVVKSKRVWQKTDHKVVIFDKEQIAQASYARDLLRTLPHVSEDPITGKLSTQHGGGLLILINGIKATDAQLKMIPPNKVVRVEYYDIPPARYAYVGTVINVITKQLDSGYAFGVQTSTALTTGFNNSSAYFSATSGKHRFDLEYYLNYRDYDDVIDEMRYDYLLNAVQHQDQTFGKDHFGYTTHSLSLKYAFVETEKQTFQATFMPDFNKSFSKTVYEGIYQKGTDINTLFKDWDEHNKTLHPSLDFYYWRKFSEKDELSLNLNLNHFQTKGDDKRKEFDAETASNAYDDLMHLDNQKQSVIGEVAYTRNLALVSKINAGYKLEYSHLLSDLTNLFGSSRYTSDYLQQYVYAESVGMRKKWMYRLSLGLTHIYNKSIENKYNRLVFTPKMILGYQFNEQNALRFVASRAPIMPTIDMLSNNALSLTRDIIKMGNPGLKNGSVSQFALMESYDNAWLSLLLAGFYQFEHHPVNQYFRAEGNKLMLTYRNTAHNQYYGGILKTQIKPFRNSLLQIDVYLQPYWQRASTPEGIQMEFAFENSFSLDLNYKRFALNYQYVIPSYSISGVFRSLSENNNNLTLSYKLKNWRFNAGILFIGKAAHYRTKTLEDSFVHYVSDRKIRDNKSMLIFGLSYDFSSGKQKNISRTLNNKDDSAPTF